MTEVTAGATTAKTAQHTASPFGLPEYAIPKFDLSNMEMPEAFREIAENSVAQAKEAYDKANVTAEKATDLLKNAYATTAKGVTDYNLKVLAIARTNTYTAFDYAHELLGVKSLQEFVELSTAHARKQFEAMTAQTKELTALAQKVATEIAEPLKTGVTKASNNRPA